MTPADVLIIGGGPAGGAAALTLARLGRRATLIDGGARGAIRVGEALPPAARPLLRDLGLLDLLQGGDHRTCRGNHAVWGHPAPLVHDFVFDPNGAGWHLDRARFDASVRAAAADAGAQVIGGAQAGRLARTDAGWRVPLRLASGTAAVVYGRYLIDATGRASVLARHLGARRRRDDRLLAFVATYRPAPRMAARVPPDAETWTRIEAVPEGWWYTAPLPTGARIVAFHTDADLADRTALRSAGGFAAQVARAPHLSAHLAAHGYTMAGRPRGIDAGSACLDRASGPGWLAAGDAALAFDPLSSQGLLNALYTGLKGATTADAVLAGDEDAPNAYTDQVRAIYRAYLRHRATFYAAEGRWPTHPFWHRRSAARQADLPT